MSMRNNLLNFRKNNKKVIEIVDENVLELFKILIFDESKMEFLPIFIEESEKLDSDEDSLNHNINNLWSMPLPDLDVPDKHKDLFLQTNIEEKELQKKLFDLSQLYKSNIEEKGQNMLFLALGCLKWTETDNSQARFAPLILVPVELNRTSVNKPFKLKWDLEEIKPNLSLEYKLKEQNIILPIFDEFYSKEDVYKYFSDVKEAIKSKNRWEVLDDIYLSFFNFRKFIMYKDLDLKNWGGVGENKLNKVFSNPQEISNELYDDDQPISSNSKDLFNVLDADSSQIEVINEVNKGRSIVVEGPPGTGKSQTIVNLIAELLAKNKTILFVSEKRAALEVVKNRLDYVNLGSACLELHSDKTKKKDVLSELDKTLNKKKVKVNDKSDFYELEKLKIELNSYMEAINKSYGRTGLTPYKLIGIREFNYQKIIKSNQSIEKFNMNNIEKLDSEKQSEILGNIGRIQKIYESIHPIKNNILRFTDFSSNLSTDDLETVKITLDNLINKINDLIYVEKEITSLTGCKGIGSFNGIEEYVKKIKILKENPLLIKDNELDELIKNIELYQIKLSNIDPTILKTNLELKKDKLIELNKNINSSNFIYEFIDNENLEEVFDDFKELKNNVNNSKLNLALKDEELIQKFTFFKSKRSSFFRYFNRDYKNIRKELLTYYSTEVSDDQILLDFGNLINWNNDLTKLREKILSYCDNDFNSDDKIIIESKKLRGWVEELDNIKEDLSNFTQKTDYNYNELENEFSKLIELKYLLEYINSKEDIGKYYFNDIWNGSKTEIKPLMRKYEVLLIFKELYDYNFFSSSTIELLNSGLDFYKVNEYLEKLLDNKQNIIKNYGNLDTILKFKGDLSPKFIFHNEFKSFKSKIDELELNSYNLNNWRLFKSYSEQYSDDYTKEFISIIAEDKINPKQIMNVFKYNLSGNILTKAIQENSILNNFNGNIHNQNIKKFKELDLNTIDLNRYRIQERLNKKIPNINKAINPSSELGILLKEINKKRRIKPIRKLLSECSNVIQDIKPCFMMSPLSVAQYLDSKVYSSHFDYVIFDEASQLKTEDSVGALLRGKEYVIMGDTKQLPPTTFFESEMEEDSENNEYYHFQDLESILHLSKSIFPSKMLKWHYRSLHESLIAVSNDEFYDNNLYVFPSSVHESEELGLKFNYNSETVYDRGKSSKNIGEAKEVVDYIFKHFDEYGYKKSLGIGTFSSKQQRAILEEIEVKLKEKPEYEKYFASSGVNSFFVKNLENIQGDERDVILVSVGYGRDAHGKITMGFGPLNKDGGERRLNVLFTRAKEKCVVFSNFKSSDIKDDTSSPRGLRALKTFLYYAEKGEFPPNHLTGEDFDSDFEKAVYSFLSDEGYEVKKQIGCNGYKIDLAIVDKEDYDNYILGIECDGSQYHSSQSARDRDRIRQGILEKRGWKFYRIWSTDWYNNREFSKKQLLTAVKYAEINKNNQNLRDDFKKTSNIESKVEIIENEVNDKEQETYYKKYEGYSTKDFYDSSDNHILGVIIRIVEIEGPIHIEEIYERLKVVYDTKATKKFKNRIYNLINLLKIRSNIIVENDFVYLKNCSIELRHRKKPIIDRIHNEELKKSIITTLETQYSLKEDDLIKSSSMLLGFKVLRKNIKSRYSLIIKDLKNEGVIIINNKEFYELSENYFNK